MLGELLFVSSFFLKAFRLRLSPAKQNQIQLNKKKLKINKYKLEFEIQNELI